MKINYKQLFVAILATTILASSAFAKVPRRIVMEDHTGAWCGWCVLGNQAMEDMLAQYQDRFIPVAVHNQDQMATALQGTIASQLGLTGYPSGLLNRMKVNINGNMMLFHHPDYWPMTVDSHILDSSIVDVNVTYTVDSVAKTLTATVTATMTEDYNGQLAFNLYIMEDDVTGVGTGWDQHNYLSGNAAYKDHPYYSQPATITNYVHKNVMRDMLGGAWGMNGSFPITAVAGATYTQDFTADLSNYKIQNYSNIWVVGIVQQTGGKYEIMNAKESGKVLPRAAYKVNPVSALSFTNGTRNQSVIEPIEFKNNSNADVVVDFSINSQGSTIPSDWSVKLSDEQITIPAWSRKSINAEISLGSTAAFGFVTINTKVESTDDYDGLSSSAQVGVLSDGVDYGMFYFEGNGIAPLNNSIQNLPNFKGKLAEIPVTSATIEAYGNYPFKLLVVPETFASRASSINSPIINIIANYINAGKPVLMTSIVDLFFAAGNDGSLVPNDATKNLFSSLGITGLTQSSPLPIGNTQTGALSVVSVKGVSGETITNGMTFNINEYNQTSFPFYSFWVDQVKIVNSDIASPILTYDISTLPAGQNIAAVKVQTATNRDIYMGFSFELIKDDASRTTLFNNMVTWLLGSSDVKDLGSMNSANMEIYPNPVVANASVKIQSGENTQADVYLVDMNGSRVASIYNGILNGEQNINFTTAGLPSGKYYMISNLNGVMSQIPVVVAK